MNLPLDVHTRDYDHLDRPVILGGNSPVMYERAAYLLTGRGFSRIYYLSEM